MQYGTIHEDSDIDRSSRFRNTYFSRPCNANSRFEIEASYRRNTREISKKALTQYTKIAGACSKNRLTGRRKCSEYGRPFLTRKFFQEMLGLEGSKNFLGKFRQVHNLKISDRLLGRFLWEQNLVQKS